jgi:apolipoprotein N-acyltransferase
MFSKIKLKPFYPHLVAIISGAGLVLSFAPFHISSIAFIAPALLLWSLHNKKPKQAFVIGYLFGLAFFGFGASWIYHSIHIFGGAPWFLAAFITAIFVAYLSLFTAIQSHILVKYFPVDNYNRIVIAFPVLWVLSEILRGWLFSGFPWAYIGYSQIDNIMRSYASIGSVWLCSLVVLIMSGMIYRLYLYIQNQERTPKKRNLVIISLFLFWPVAYVLDDINWTKPIHEGIPVSMVQGNIPQMMRWDPNEVKNILSHYSELTANEWGNKLIIWPEGAIPLPVNYATPFLKQLEQISTDTNTALIVGIPEHSKKNNDQFYNTLLGIGHAKGAYRKDHLVPFGEYVPFESILRGLIDFFDLPMSEFVPFSQKQEHIDIFGYKLGSAICYEIAYPNLVKNRANQSNAILTVGNDAWFGRTIGPHQHLQIAQMRAIETGRPVLRATNNGITAMISPNGRLRDYIPQFTTDVLQSSFTPVQGHTPWMILGVWPLIALLMALGGFGYWRQHFSPKNH